MPLRWESRTSTHKPEEVANCNSATGLLEPFTCTHSQSSPIAPSFIASLQIAREFVQHCNSMDHDMMAAVGCKCCTNILATGYKYRIF
ncbi:hypothetical protein E2C01_026000 [Portunus trituberculatus]|uniref:Uncharacterized protein n=1 Tax=Portunus trituberculatus TaxID=210409 RepID=A0A5B7EH07_PORTR|nr:hypothetical protein [Portunus trituberculatus]